MPKKSLRLCREHLTEFLEVNPVRWQSINIERTEWGTENGTCEYKDSLGGKCVRPVWADVVIVKGRAKYA